MTARSRARSFVVPVSASVFVTVVVSACANGSPIRRDAAVAPDARFAMLDAPFGGADAAMPDVQVIVMPDARVVSDDDAAMAPGTDAFVPSADAFVAATDAFVPATDAGRDAASSCSESPCRILAPQCGCAAGESCYPNAATRLCATTGTRPEGNGCAEANDCAAGLGCVNFSSDPTRPGNMCSRVCATDADCTGGAICIHTIDDGTGGTVPGLQFCSRACTPAPNAGCPTGLACTLFQENTGAMRVFTDCAGPVGTGRQFAPCVDDLDCAAGFACFNTGLGNECLAWCRVASPSCPLGTTCVSVGTAGGVAWGACG